MATFTDIGSVIAKPWVHYIPAKIDSSDLQEKINWARENDEELQKISKNGVELSKNMNM